MPVRLIALLVSLAFVIPAAIAQADETDTENPVIMTYATPELAPELFRDKDDVRTASFCGACTISDDCGDGWVCCTHGCSDDKRKCYEAVSCDKVVDETSPLKLFASK